MHYIYNIFSELLYWYLASEKQRLQLLDVLWIFGKFKDMASIVD